MRPAFSSDRSAAGFVSLLLLLLLLPAFVGKSRLPTRKQAYATQGWGWGPFPWIRNQIFEETNDIDIAFVGSSQIFFDIDTPYVEAKLSERLGRPAVVRTIGWSAGGYDALYFFTRDLLEHRHVHLLVFYDEAPRAGGRNRQTPFWFHWHDDAELVSGLPVAEQSFYYYAAILGMPRNLLALLRPDYPAPLALATLKVWMVLRNAPNPATRLGCFSTRQGFRPSPEADDAAFEPFVPMISTKADSAVAYALDTKSKFEFLSVQLPAWQTRFVGQFALLLQDHGIQPVMLDLPTTKDLHLPVVPERTFWPERFPGGITLLGIPQAELFGPLTDAEVKKMFWDPYHLNENGQAYFTREITPALLKLYEAQPPL